MTYKQLIYYYQHVQEKFLKKNLILKRKILQQSTKDFNLNKRLKIVKIDLFTSNSLPNYLIKMNFT